MIRPPAESGVFRRAVVASTFGATHAALRAAESELSLARQAYRHACAVGTDAEVQAAADALPMAEYMLATAQQDFEAARAALREVA